jgi:DNA-binding IclR family transcriptional regulator
MTAVPTDTAPAEVVAGNDRALDVIDALVTRTGAAAWGVRELGDHLGASRSTVNRVLQGLTARGLATVDAAGAYTVGPRLRVLTHALFETHPTLGGARDIIAELGTACEATVMVALQSAQRTTAFIALVHERPGPIRYHLIPGMTLPLHAGAAGRAILGAVGVHILGGDELQQFSEETITDRQLLQAELDKASQQGFVTSTGQHIPLAAGCAAPFLLDSGIVGAISVTRSRYETTDADLLRFGPLVVTAARQVAAQRPLTTAPGPVRAAQPAAGGKDTPGGSALNRIERLINALIAHPEGIPATSRDLSKLVGAVGPTAERLRVTALHTGLAIAPQPDRIHPGPLLLKWAAILGPRLDVSEIVRPEIEALAAEVGETIGHVTYNPGTGTAIMETVAWGNTPLKYGLATGVEIPLYAGAAGKAILAFAPPEIVEQQVLVPLNPKTITNTDELREQLDLIRENGWATGDGERIPDAYGVAAPIFTDGNVSGSVTISIPSYRSHETDLNQLSSALIHTTNRISRMLSVNVA